MRQKSLDMTRGQIWKLLLLFVVPLFLGNLFQQLYNTVDSIVVGNFVGKQALAAIGSTTSIVNTFVLFFNGTSVGASVVVSQSFGANDKKRLHDAVQTTITLTLGMCLFLTIAGCLLVMPMLRMMSTPDDVIGQAATYLRIYFAGISGLLLYNMGSGILRAVGDTRRPLLFLVICCVINIVLDLVFVIGFHLGIAGVGYATIFAQMVSAVLVLTVLTRTDEGYKIEWSALGIDRQLLKNILCIGIPTGLQQAITAFSNVFVQSYINSFGSDCMAGWSSYIKVNQFIMLPIQSMGQTVTTFVGQNIGAGCEARAQKGTRTGLGIALAITAASGVLLVGFAPALARLFTQDETVLPYSVLFIRLCSWLTVFCCFTQILAGSLRGRGNARTPMLIMLSSYVLFRQTYLYVMTRYFYDTPAVVGFSYPAGWIVCALATGIYYCYSRSRKKQENPAVQTEPCAE